MDALTTLEQAGYQFSLTDAGMIRYSYHGDAPAVEAQPLLADIRARRDEIVAILAQRETKQPDVLTAETKRRVVFPADSQLAFPAGSWRRLDDGRIEAQLNYNDLQIMRQWRADIIADGGPAVIDERPTTPAFIADAIAHLEGAGVQFVVIDGALAVVIPADLDDGHRATLAALRDCRRDDVQRFIAGRSRWVEVLDARESYGDNARWLDELQRIADDIGMTCHYPGGWDELRRVYELIENEPDIA